jgi:hypothetical protein
MEVPILFDGRGICDSKAARAAGFEYLCMGGKRSLIQENGAVEENGVAPTNTILIDGRSRASGQRNQDQEAAEAA